VPAAGLPLRKWLNTSGQSYRALGKAKVDAATDAALRAWLSADGKLVKRPVLVRGATVLVGFDADRWSTALGG
jgi:arsenate reductase